MQDVGATPTTSTTIKSFFHGGELGSTGID